MTSAIWSGKAPQWMHQECHVPTAASPTHLSFSGVLGSPIVFRQTLTHTQTHHKHQWSHIYYYMLYSTHISKKKLFLSTFYSKSVFNQQRRKKNVKGSTDVCCRFSLKPLYLCSPIKKKGASIQFSSTIADKPGRSSLCSPL